MPEDTSSTSSPSTKSATNDESVVEEQLRSSASASRQNTTNHDGDDNGDAIVTTAASSHNATTTSPPPPTTNATAAPTINNRSSSSSSSSSSHLLTYHRSSEKSRSTIGVGGSAIVPGACAVDGPGIATAAVTTSVAAIVGDGDHGSGSGVASATVPAAAATSTVAAMQPGNSSKGAPSDTATMESPAIDNNNNSSSTIDWRNLKGRPPSKRKGTLVADLPSTTVDGNGVEDELDRVSNGNNSNADDRSVMETDDAQEGHNDDNNATGELDLNNVDNDGNNNDDDNNNASTPSNNRGSNPDPAPSLPVAEVYEEPPLVSAEMVIQATTAPRPVHAVPVVYHVDIDAEHQSSALHVSDDRDGAGEVTSGGRRMKSNNRRMDGDGYDVEEASVSSSRSSSRKAQRSQRRRQWIAFFIGALVSLIVATIIGVILGSQDDQDKGDSSTTSSTTATTDVTVIDDDGPDKTEFPYKCFTSTLDILTYQIEAPEDEVMNDNNPIIICPNTTIKVGTFRNPQADDLGIIDGDHPINILRPNVTIQCGLDGHRSNNCTIAGGLIQVVVMYEYIHPTYGIVKAPPVLDGFTLRGMTFTGFIEGRFVFGGIPVTMSHPGVGNRFEDCAWQNLSAAKRMIAVGQNYIMELRGVDVPPLSVDLTVSNCLFEDNVYEEEFFVNFGQILHVENSTFRNNALSSILSSGCGFHPDGCRNIIHGRSGPTRVSISNVCVEDFDSMGAAPISISAMSEFASSGSNIWYGPVLYDGNATQPTSTAVFPTTNPSFCELGVAQFETDERSFVCLNETVFEHRLEGSCP